MLAAESIVDIWDNGDGDDGSDTEGCADEAEEGAVWVIEVYDPSISTIRMYPDGMYQQSSHGFTACKPFMIEPSYPEVISTPSTAGMRAK